jgi:NADPH:quinone reductase-like Zn-dependent oxidoreductase
MTVKQGGARAARLPLLPCSDGAGEVVEVGPGVTRVKVGDRVAGIFFQSWLAGDITAAYFASALGGTLDGMLADLVVLHEDGLAHFPTHMTYEDAATLPCAAVTAWQGQVTKGGMKAGDTILRCRRLCLASLCRHDCNIAVALDDRVLDLIQPL